jgi:amino acid transporter
LTLPGAVALNMLDMIGVGPFITLPLLLAAMGGPQAMLGWIFGALLALADGLVWAELAGMMPEAGGSYRFLREMFPGSTGRFLGFLFCFQLMFSAPLSMASGCIGLAQYAGYLWPGLRGHTWIWGRLVAGPATAVAVGCVVAVTLLLYRRLANLRLISYALWGAVLATIAWVLVTGVLFGQWKLVTTLPPGAFHLNGAFFAGLASAMLIATYDFWGYYNVAFLAGEVRDAARNVPRAILLSIGIVSVLYVAMNTALLALVPWQTQLGAHDLNAREALVSYVMEAAYGARFGPGVGLWAGRAAALLVMVTAFGSVFSLLLGYSRIPFAAARDGNFFRAFGKLHPRGGFPYVSLLYLAGAAGLFCFLSLGEVIAALVVLRIVVQFLLQHVGVMALRRTQAERARPFRMLLYPLPPLLALAGFVYILVARTDSARQLWMAAGVVVLGAAVYRLRGLFSVSQA